MAPAGLDFLESLEELFQEASTKGFVGKEDFGFVKEKLLKLLVAVSQTTAARARASCPIELPDGSEPDTFIQLPPSTLKVDEVTRDHLEQATTGHQFVQVLEDAFEAQRRRKTTSAQKRKRRLASEIEKGSAPITPKQKIKVKIDVRTPVAVEEAKKKKNKKKKKKKKGEEIDTATPAAVEEETAELEQQLPSPAATILETRLDADEKIDADQKIEADQQTDANLQTDIATVPDKQSTMTPSTFSQDLFQESPTLEEQAVSLIPEDVSEKQHLPGHDAMELDNAPMTNMAIQEKGEAAAKGNIYCYDEAHQEIDTDLDHLLDEAAHTTPEQWEDSRQKMATFLARLKAHRAAPLEASLDPRMQDDRRLRLQDALGYLWPDISKVPESNWATYKRKLFQFCDSAQIATLSFPQRLYKVMDIIYLPEETLAVPERDWDRMLAVVRICAVVTEAMGPEDENVPEMAERWIRSKAKDMAFLRKIMASIKRANECCPPPG